MFVAVAIAVAMQPATGFDLKWTAPADCPDADADRWLADRPRPDETVRANATVTGDPDSGYALVLTIETADGEVVSETESQSCETLAEAVALQVAMAVDPSLALDFGEHEAQAGGDAEPVPPPDPTAPGPSPEPTPEPVKKPPTEPRTRFAAWLEGAAEARRVPTVDGRFGGGGSVLIENGRFDLGYLHTFGQRKAYPGIPDVGLDIRHWALVVRGCYRPEVKRVEFPVCGGGEFGALAARGFGVDVPALDRGPWVALTASGGLMVNVVKWFSLGVALTGFVALTLPPATVDALDPFFAPSRLGGGGVLRLEARFP
jgi:hypothetical protein